MSDSSSSPWWPILACCMALPSVDYDRMRAIFESQRLRMMDIPVFWQWAHDQGYGRGTRPFEIIPLARLALLERMPSQFFEDACLVVNSGMQNSICENFQSILRNILALRDGKPLEPLPCGSDLDLFFLRKTTDELIQTMVKRPAFAGWLRAIPFCLVGYTLRDMLPDLQEDLTTFDQLPALRAWVARLLGHGDSVGPIKPNEIAKLPGFSDWCLRDSVPDVFDSLELHETFLRQGHPQERLAVVNPSSCSGFVFQALGAMDAGQANLALALLRQGIKSQRKSETVFHSPLANFFYGMALFECRRTAAAQRTLRSLANSYKVLSEVRCAPLDLLVHCALDEGADRTLRDLLDCCPLETKVAGLLVLIARAFHLKTPIPPRWVKAFDECCQVYPWFALEAKNLEAPGSEAVAALASDLGMRPILPVLEDKPEWQRQLELLIELQTKDAQQISAKTAKSAKGGEDKTVLCFMLGRDALDVSLVLRKTSDDLHFGKGKPVAVSSLVRDRIPQATDSDIRIGQLAQEERYGRRGVFTLSGPEVVRELIGHPYVFDASHPDRHLQIEPMALEIRTQTSSRGLRITSNVSHDEVNSGWPCFVHWISKERIGVITPTATQRRLLEALEKQGAELPLAARDLLATLVEQLSVNTTVVSDLLAGSEKLEKVAGSTVITFRIEPDREAYRVAALVKPVAKAPLTCQPGLGEASYALNVDGKPIQVERNLDQEKANFDALEEKLAALEESHTKRFAWELDAAGCLALLNVVHESAGIAALEWPRGEPMKVAQSALTLEGLRLSVRRNNHWFDIVGDVQLDQGAMLSIAELLKKYQSAIGDFIAVGDKEYVRLSEGLQEQLRRLADSATPAGARAKGVQLSIFRSDVLENLHKEMPAMDVEEPARELLARVANAQAVEPMVPAALQAELRDYQFEGFAWMARLASWGAGMILADDMGLGKTVQTIALLAARSSLGPQLVVMPTSVLSNWEDELRRFAPALRVHVFNREDRKAVAHEAAAGDVVLSSYGVMASDIALLKQVTWATAVLDEAHTIKNRATKMSQAAMALTAEGRVLLTGTPLQNHLSEIWNLLQFANPGLLGSYERFMEHFITPIEVQGSKTVQRQLKRLVAPFILRRTKAQVLDELPQKTEQVIHVQLSDGERILYESLREAARSGIETGQINPIAALAELTKLRLAACHPSLASPGTRLASAKTAAFLELVDSLIEGGHRALVFSQFTSHLALIRKALEDKGIAYVYLDGSNTARERARLVEEFQKGDAPLFLISLKAGGTGLNLTAADYVIHLSPWWNPAIEDQASDRAYRIGQDRPVTIYKLIAEHTIEERILALHASKKSQADALLEGTDVTSRLSREELLALLQDRSE